MQPTTVQLQESKALASTCSMSNRFYKVGWDVEHMLNVIFEILSASVVILLHGLSSICLSFLQRVLIRSWLSLTQQPRYSDKQKSNQTTRPRKTAKREATRHRNNNYTERMQKEEWLSPLGGYPNPWAKEQEWWFAKHKLKPKSSQYFLGRSCQPLWLKWKWQVCRREWHSWSSKRFARRWMS
jgi:hypothetical protein